MYWYRDIFVMISPNYLFSSNTDNTYVFICKYARNDFTELPILDRTKKRWRDTIF